MTDAEKVFLAAVAGIILLAFLLIASPVSAQTRPVCDEHGCAYVPDYAQRSIDKTIVTRHGRTETLRMPPGTGTTYQYLFDDNDEDSSREEESDSWNQ